MRQKRYGITHTNKQSSSTISILIDLSDIGNINRRRLDELRKINNALSGNSILTQSEESILERMVEIVIHNLRRNRDRIPYPDIKLENTAFYKNMDNTKAVTEYYSDRTKIIYALVEAKVKAALDGFWDIIYEPLETTAILVKALSNSSVLVIISRQL